jgi:hypothetical protein
MAYNEVIFEGFFAVSFGLSLNTLPSMALFSTEFTQRPNRHIQERALRIILPNQSYHENLKTLKLPTLTERRESLSMRFCKKICCDTSSKLFKELLPKPVNHEHRCC